MRLYFAANICRWGLRGDKRGPTKKYWPLFMDAAELKIVTNSLCAPSLCPGSFVDTGHGSE